MSAPWRRAAPRRWPTRSTPTTQPNPPARPASTPATASSNTAHVRGLDAQSAAAAARNVSGAGLPRRPPLGWRRRRRRAPRRGARCRRRPAPRGSSCSPRRPRAAGRRRGPPRRTAPSPRTRRRRRARMQLEDQLVLARRQGRGRSAPSAGRPAAPSGSAIPRDAQERPHAVGPQLAVDVRRRSRSRSRRAGTARPVCRDRSRRKASNISFQAAACTLAVCVRTPSRSNRQAAMPSGSREPAPARSRPEHGRSFIQRTH